MLVLKDKSARKIEQSTWNKYFNRIKKLYYPIFAQLDLDIKDMKPQHIRNYYDYKFNQGMKYKKVAIFHIRQ